MLHIFERKDFYRAQQSFNNYWIAMSIITCFLQAISSENDILQDIILILLMLGMLGGIIFGFVIMRKPKDFELQIQEEQDKLVVIFSDDDKRLITRYFRIDETYRDVIFISDGFAKIKLPNEPKLLEFLRNAALEGEDSETFYPLEDSEE